MKKILFTVIAAATIFSCTPKNRIESVAFTERDIAGDWSGSLSIGKTELELVLHINDTAAGLRAELDSISQGAMGIVADSIDIGDEGLVLRFTSIKAEYRCGMTKEGRLEGQWSQGGSNLKLSFEKSEAALGEIMRTQEPAAPFPYKTMEVKFKNDSANINLAGTLTYPETGKAEYALILVSGSGAQNRDEELMNHKPFLVIADYMTRNGIAVLRYDDRGTAESEGDFGSATTVDLASDTDAAVRYLARQNFVKIDKIGIAGHSEGGLIAPYVANRNADVDFIILLAGPGVSGKRLLQSQSEVMLRASGAAEGDIKKAQKMNNEVYSILLSSSDKSMKEDKINSILSKSGLTDEQIEAQTAELFSTWFQFFLAYDPEPEIQKLNIPVLALNGSRDLQVVAELNLGAIKDAADRSGEADITVKELDGLNHLFQPAESGLPSEYANIETTFSEEALDVMCDWIIKL